MGFRRLRQRVTRLGERLKRTEGLRHTWTAGDPASSVQVDVVKIVAVFLFFSVLGRLSSDAGEPSTWTCEGSKDLRVKAGKRQGGQLVASLPMSDLGTRWPCFASEIAGDEAEL